MKTYNFDEALASSKEYFRGDELSASVWVSKYALKDSDGNIYELNPDMMHHRIAAEFARIEDNYPNGMSEPEIYELLKDFKFIIPQGGPMSGIGNSNQVVSLSNCFVIGHDHPADSYGGILMIDEEQARIFWNRRSRAPSFSIDLRYSSTVVAPIH